ncbi:MAG: hypothetical protein Kow00106_10020 [Anaerolineae bacterium]
MTQALTPDQVRQIVTNTVVVLLARPDLAPEWQAHLLELLDQARQQQLEDEQLFVAAVVTLLGSPDDTLPTGTVYDHVWQALITSLRTGRLIEPEAEADTDTLDELLGAVVEAVVAARTVLPDQATAIAAELRDLRAAAERADAEELVRWVDDALAVLAGESPQDRGTEHEGVYAAYWQALRSSLSESTTH